MEDNIKMNSRKLFVKVQTGVICLSIGLSSSIVQVAFGNDFSAFVIGGDFLILSATISF
jgi:hypothetical protein